MAITQPIECRLIIDPPSDGAWNMAADEALLIDAAENGTTTLRFYGWSEPTLSLGYFQRYAERDQHEPSLHCALVRRQTGGGAILHDRELTYSIVLPASHALARQTPLLYAAVHDAFIAAIGPAISADASWALRRRDEVSTAMGADEPFLCFQRQAPGDVLLGATSVQSEAANRRNPDQRANWKILGSAQRRHRGAVLQHGSLLLDRAPAAPEIPGVFELTGANLEPGPIAKAVTGVLAGVLNVRLAESPFPPQLESNAAELAINKYGGPVWTNRR
jgi:lipoate-protein ligase A